jgi:hypothetical protein
MILAAIWMSPVWSLSVDGAGAFRLEDEGRVVYVREGNFTVRDGLIVHTSGLPLTPPIRLQGCDEQSIRFEEDGAVVAKKDGILRPIGRLVLADLTGVAVSRQGEVWIASQPPRIGAPATNGFGRIRTNPAQPKNPPSSKQGEFEYGFVLYSKAEVTGSEIRLQDVARVVADPERAAALGRLLIGSAPTISSVRAVTPVTIQGVLRAEGFDLTSVWFDGAPRCEVRRKSRVVPAGEVQQFGMTWAKQTWGDAEWAATSPTRDFVAADGEIEFRVLSTREVSDTVVLAVEARVGDERQFSTQIILKKVALSKDAPLPTVKVNQTVRVTIVSRGVSVTTTGRVKAVDGNQITVFVEETKATLVGILKPDGTVEVQL